MKPISVMIADDDQLVLDYLQTLVDWNALGFELTACAHNGAEAFKLVKKLRPDILITDIVMPGMDGLTLIERLKGLHPGLSILIITSYDEFDYAKRAIQMNVCDYILKNEITAASLTAKLDAIASSIRHSSQVSSSYLRQELAAYFKENDQKGLPESLSAIARERYYFFILSQAAACTRSISQAADARQASLEYLASVLTYLDYPSSHQFVHDGFLVCALRLESTEQERHYSLNSITRKLWQRLASSAGHSCSLFYYPHRLDMASFRALFHEALPLLEFFTMFCPGAPADMKKMLHDEHYNPITRPFQFQLLDGSKERLEEHILSIKEYLAGCCNNRNLNSILDFYQNFCTHAELLSHGGLSLWEPRYFSTPEALSKWIFDTYADAVHMRVHGNTSRYSPAVSSAIAYMEQHYSEASLNAEMISQHAALSVSRLGVLFKQETNRTINEYLTRLRIDNAVYFLQNTSMKIYEISEKCGYRSSQYFSQIFCQYTGRRPIDYRKT